jgi:tetratricopeptide (TPR) repeat protein
LKGSVQRVDEQLRIHVRLIDAQTRFRLWSDIYERRADELFSIQQDIARQVLVALKLAIPVDIRNQRRPLSSAVVPTVAPPTNSVMAYDYYLQARSQLRDSETFASLDETAEFFTRAIDHDAGFADAYAGLCATMVKQIQIRPAAGLIGPADTVCRKAIELGPESIYGYAAYGEFYRVTDRPHKAIDEYLRIIERQPRTLDAYLGIGNAYADLGADDEAEHAYRMAIEIRPDDARAYQAYVIFLSNQGRYREVLENGRRLIQLDPQSVTGYAALGNAAFISGQFTAAIAAYREVINRERNASTLVEIGSSLYYLGRYRAATQTYQLAVEMNPMQHRTWGRLGDVYQQTSGGGQQAIDAYSIARGLAEDDLQDAPNGPMTQIALAYYCAALGDSNCAIEHSATALTLAPQSPVVQYVNALVYLHLGNESAAIEAVEYALELGYPRALFRVDPQLVAVRSSSRLAGAYIAERAMARNQEFNARISSLSR